MDKERNIELLSPAGSMQVLEAAIAAGANAAYLGMKHFNARTGAKNFTPAELENAVKIAHANNVRIYLTLNTMLAQRELGMAARSLAVAQNCGVDGVLVTDPAYLLFKDAFPKLEFHFSTQAGISSSAGVRAGKKLGLTRVVLARELSADEIRIATATPGVETEVFIQGALCFSCSGRCLLSSWGGGRSGNRGSCTSPCRVAWNDADGQEDRPMSMHDLCLVERVAQLKEMGVASLKIEGRLKTADWVTRAVSLYRNAIDAKKSADDLREAATSLGDYTGRELTDGYFTAQRTNMTGESKRQATKNTTPCSSCAEPQQPAFTLSVAEDEKGATLLTFASPDNSEIYRIPPQRIANAKRAVSVADMATAIMEAAVSMRCTHELKPLDATLEAKILPRNAVNQAVDAATSFMRAIGREEDGLPRGVTLPPEVDVLLKQKPVLCKENCRSFNATPDRVRVNWDCIADVPPGTVPIVCCYPENEKDAIVQANAVLSCNQPIASLPQVMYEYQLQPMAHLIAKLAENNVTFEVNSWDGLQLLLETAPNASFETGPGLAVLNALAAKELASLGAKCVAVSQEIDKLQLECLCQACEVPLALTVLSCPQLMMTRTVLPGKYSTLPFTDARGITLVPMKEGPLTVLRPSIPYDWRKLRNPQVKAAHIVADYRGLPKTPSTFLFNYDRTLR